jgi:hypothetical protein
MGVVADPDALDAVTGLQVVGGGASFTGRNCEVEWTFTDHPRLKDFVVQIAKPDDTVLRTDQVKREDRRYTYDFEKNRADTGGTPVRTFVVTVWARNVYDKLSTGTSLQVSNPAPTMAGTSPTVVAITRGLMIDWRLLGPADNDLTGFSVFCDTSLVGVTAMSVDPVAVVDAGTRQWWAHGLEPDDTYYVRVLPWDGFGSGTASSIAAEEPLRTSSEDVLLELSSSIKITDSEGNSYEPV